MSANPCHNVHTVPMSQPFVDALADHLLACGGDAPDALARMLVLVPTRRAVTSLRDTLLRRSGGRPLLLPSIQPIGEIDIELLMPELLWGGEAEARPELPPAISSRQRVFELAKLIETFQTHTGHPVAADQSVMLAQALGDLIDQMARDEVPYERLHGVVEGELANHWQRTLNFLRIITEHWPRQLRELKRIDAVERRSRVLSLLREYWEKYPPSHPVIAAGTTGSIPATARLLQLIASLPEGRVILPGLDQACDAETWNAIGHAPSHPQHGLFQLLASMGCAREQVQSLSAFSENGKTSAARADFINAVMMPAALSHRWREMTLSAEVLDGVTMVECADEAEESQAIALMLRDALEQPETQAMLVTHDRALARRVAVLLRRYGLDVEDGGGVPLLQTPAAVFALLLLHAAEAQAPTEVLALLKHPLCSLGVSPEVKFTSVCEIELAFFRGIRSGETLKDRVERLPSLEGFSAEAATCLTRLAEALEPLSSIYNKERVALPDAIALLVTVMERLAERPEQSGAERLWGGHDGHQLAGELSDIRDHADYLGEVAPGTLSALLARLLSRESYQPPHVRQHPRLTILSPADARMQHADLVILAGLNEGCWPPAPQSDPWMSRAMRESIGLQPYERQIGLAAHDFASLCAATRVILTRAEKVGGSPQHASRWWLRLMTVLEALPEAERAAFLARGRQWRGWVAEFSETQRIAPLERPRPTPPAEARPTVVSVSQVERLMRDPYAFYTQCILQLKALDPVDMEPGMAEFGNAVHKALEHFAGRYPEQLPENAEAELTALIDISFAELIHKVRAPSFWRRRLQRIVREVIAVERSRRELLLYIEPERVMEAAIPHARGQATLRARADRVDHRRDGQVDLVDFKTGGMPTGKEVKAGYAPQLTLEGLLLQEAGQQVGQMLYWKVPAGEAEPLKPAGGDKADPQTLIAEAREGLQRLLAFFADPATPYVCLADTPTAPKYSDYEHLERLEEWR